MEAERYERLVGLMEAIAAGDDGAVFALEAAYGGDIARVVRSELARVGVPRPPLEDVQALVVDVCLELRRLAHAWDPGVGVMPWTWARRRISSVVCDYVGIHADSLDEDRMAAIERRAYEPAPADEPGSIDVLAELAGWHDRSQLLVEALDRISPRNRELLLETQLQASLGDGSPAVTLAREHNMTPEAVRQAVKRTKDRLRDLVAADERYSPLADTPLVA